MTTNLLRRLVDDEQWEAEDNAGRLGIAAHAAFLRAGFEPCGDEPSSGCLFHKQVDEIGPSAPSLSRRYTAPQLARRGERAPAPVDVAVLELRAWTNGDVAFRAYLLTTDGHRLRVCEAVLDAAALAPLLSGRLDDAARALETGAAGAWLWKSLLYWVFPVLLHELCRRNDLPLTDFTSLPDDAKAEILKRLADGKDLARVECTSKQLQHFVAERDGEIWKAVYESLGLSPEAESSESEGLGSWKERYVNAKRQPQRRRRSIGLFLHSYEEWLARRRREREAELQERVREFDFSRHLREEHEADLQRVDDLGFWYVPLRQVRQDSFFLEPLEFGVYDFPPYMVHDPPAPPPEPEAVARRKNAGRHRRKAPRQDFQKKRHGAGATHSPSSRYKWKHR